jgi:coenzyme F420-0:L-glutamate ligase / coenzyme F420-1:gamma-L-glutamate ligase
MTSVRSLSIIPVTAPTRFEPFDLHSEILHAIYTNAVALEDGDIVVVSSKYAAIAEGRMMDLSKIQVTGKGQRLADQYSMDPALAQLVLDEADSVLGGIPGFALSLVLGTLAPNSGVDKSNVPKGWAVQYPKDPFRTAANLRESLLENLRFRGEKAERLGVVLSDSRVTPTRLGTIGVAVAWAGIKPTIDMRGSPDLAGNNLVVTLRAVGDQLVSAAQLVMGESDEGRPIVIVRGFEEAFSEAKNDFEKRTTIDPNHCLILSSLRNPPE